MKYKVVEILSKEENYVSLEKVRKFLDAAEDVSFGYRAIFFSPKSDLIKVDSEQWLQIASDDVGDQIIIDITCKQLSVFVVNDKSKPILIADSFDSFIDIIRDLRIISLKRTTPIQLDENPITNKELSSFLVRISIKNSESVISYWEYFLETAE